MNKKMNTNLLFDEFGNVVTAFHGTYYNFDYFFPLSHFGSEKVAKTVLKEGKWKRDKNIDITKPKIIPVHFKPGNYFEIPDLNNHYAEDWRAVLLAFLLDKSIIADIDNLCEWNDIQKKCNVASLKMVPYQYDFVLQPINTHIDANKIGQEIAFESLYSDATAENLFLQRMIRFFESVGISGFMYKNFTESGGDNSYITFRQDSVIWKDKEVPPMQLHINTTKLQNIEHEFKKQYLPRVLTAKEKDIWIKQLYGFYDFRKAEIARQQSK